MKMRMRSQDISITSELIEDAVAEQLKSQAADVGLEKGKRGTIATPQQMFGVRHRADAIIIGLIDDWSDPKIKVQKIWDRSVQCNPKLQGSATKRKTHRGRRLQESYLRRAIRE